MPGDPVKQFLRARGCPDDVVAEGLEGLVSNWERIAAEVRDGYPLGLDDYLNDLDARQLLEGALTVADADEDDPVRARVDAADRLMRSAVRPVTECLWGDAVAAMEGWTPENNWWYFSLPRVPGTMLRDDLAGD